MKRFLRFGGILILVVLLSLGSNLVAQGPGHHGHRPPFWELLTPDQRATVEQLVTQMREDGATRDQIRDAIRAQLHKWGIERPEHAGGRHPFDRIMRQLNEDRRAILHELINNKHENGATREEIWQAIVTQLEEWGIELPEPEGQLGPRLRHLMRQLTPQQRATVFRTVRQMRGTGASRGEIRLAILALLKEFGIELPGEDEPVKGRTKIEAMNHPNPFNPETQISYVLGEPGNVEIEIFNIAGQRIRAFTLGYQQEGRHHMVWDGVAESGRAAPSGIYLFRIQSGAQSVTRRMLLMR